MPPSSRRRKSSEPRPDSGWTRALAHEVANLLAGARMTGHFLGGPVGVAERTTMARSVERLTCHAAAMLGQIRPLLDGTSDRRVRVRVSSILGGLENVSEGAIERERLRVPRGTGLPEVRVDPDAVHHVLVALVMAAAGDSEPAGKVRITAKLDGTRVVIAVMDEAPRFELTGAPSPSLGGRELALTLGDAVLRTMGGRARSVPRRRGNQVELVLPAVRSTKAVSAPSVRRPRAGPGARRRP